MNYIKRIEEGNECHHPESICTLLLKNTCIWIKGTDNIWYRSMIPLDDIKAFQQNNTTIEDLINSYFIRADGISHN